MPVLIGLLTGFISSIPVGPVGVSVAKASLNKGARYGIAIGAGAALMDSIYLFIGLIGLSLFSFDETTNFIIRCIGIVFLFTLGIKELLPQKQQSASKSAGRPKKRKYFLLGIMFYITNPILIVTFTGIAAMIKSSGLIFHNTLNNTLLALSVGVGTACWFALLSWLFKKYKKKMSERILTRINTVSGYALIGFGLYLSYQTFIA